jgi:organic radical activating enzyme
MNQQAPEKRISDHGNHLAVNSIFYTIQGEGPFAGEPAVFVRLAGCNLQCPLCDTEYTDRRYLVIDDIVQNVLRERGSRCNLVVITGGEPFRQPIGLLVRDLIRNGFRVQVETNGTLWQPAVNVFDPKLTIVCSPKAGNVNRDLLPFIAAWKYVATADNIDPEDGLPLHALEHPCGGKLYRPPAGHTAPVYLQPVDEKNTAKNARNQRAVVEACMKHGHRLCLQLHKIVGLD